MSGVYRPLKTKRFVMITMGGLGPVLQKLPNGHLGVVTRDGDFHRGERGCLVLVTSLDGGESWSHPTVVAADGPDNRNPAFEVAADGALLVTFIKQVNYTDGNYDFSGALPTPLYISRSEDNGATWSTSLAKVDGQESWNVASPFGKMVTLRDGTVIMSYYDSSTSFLIRSHDGGRTWVAPVTIATGGYNETAICDLGDGRLLVVMRDNDEAGMYQSDSEDGGYTWSEPRRLTGPAEHPGDVIRLQDGRLLLTYGRRLVPWGVQGMLSTDDGRTWDENNKVLLVGDSGSWDQGYPSSIQRDDGTIVTAYYSSELHIIRPRPAEILGIHGAVVIYRPEDL